jgi:hypothetical protein
MINFLLLDAQAPAVPNFGVFEQLTNYGALGIVVLALGAAAWFFVKRQMDEKDRLEKKVEELEKLLRGK